MAPTLYYCPASPPVRSVLLTAKAIDLELDLQLVNIMKGEQMKPEFLNINPQHTVPTLVDEDGHILWDSHSIVMYLVEKYGQDDSLYPKDVQKRSIVNQRLCFNCGTLLPKLVQPLVGGILVRGMKEVPKEKIEEVENAYSLLETFLEHSEYVAGNELTVADFCNVASVTSLKVLVPISSASYPKTLAWLEKIESLPYYEEANQKGLDELIEALKSKLL